MTSNPAIAQSSPIELETSRQTFHPAASLLDYSGARLLRSSDRFLSVDSDLFLDPNITSPEYVSRYGPATVES